MNRTSTVVLALGMALALTGCGGNAGIQVEDAWARTSASIQDAGAVYLTIKGGTGADRLVGAAVPSSVATSAGLHETVTEGDEGAQMMMMQEVEGIDVPAQGEAKLEPGGYHIMLMQLAEPLETGSQFTVTLTFENAGTMEVVVEVREDQ